MTTHSYKKRVTLDQVFAPRSIAVVGVSQAKMSFAETVVFSLKEAKFPNIYPVNPRYKEIFGLPCYKNILEIPGPVDHVIVSIPAHTVLSLLDKCGEKGVRSVHFFTAGFSESGRENRVELENEMLRKARAGGFRIIGPNCTGLLIPRIRLANGIGIPMVPGPIGYISQSGGHAQSLPTYSAVRGLGFSKVVSYGNGLDVDECELLDYFLEDTETEILAAYIEGVKHGRRFFDALKKTAAAKPVIIYKGGQTEAGKRAAMGHTASMASSVAVFNGMCRQVNAIMADSLEEMIDILVALRFMGPFPKGRGVGFFGSGGGPSVLAADKMEKEGLILPPFSDEVKEALAKNFPVDGSIFTNPLDTNNLTTPDAVAKAVDILGRSPDIHMLVYHFGFHPIGSWGLGRFLSPAYFKELTDIFTKGREKWKKPVLLALRPPTETTGMDEFSAFRKAFVDAGFPVFHAMDSLARAVSRVISWKNAY